MRVKKKFLLQKNPAHCYTPINGGYGREVGGTIAKRGDRWSVTKLPPTDQAAERSGDRSPRMVIGGQ